MTITTEYTGPKLFPGDTINTNYIKVYVNGSLITTEEADPGHHTYTLYNFRGSKLVNSDGTTTLKVYVCRPTGTGDYDIQTVSVDLSEYILTPVLKAKYKGPDISLGKNYNVNDVEVYIDYGDGTVKILDATQYTLSSNTLINHTGPNSFSAVYTGTEHISWYTAEYIVNGYREILEVNCKYIGPSIYVYHNYNINNVIVTLFYKDSPAIPVNVPISKCLTNPDLCITKNGNNTFYLTYTHNEQYVESKTFKLGYIVPGIGIDSIKAQYNGPDIFVNHEYSLNDVTVNLIYLDGYTTILANDKCIFNPDKKIYNAYDNIYEVTFIDNDNNKYTAEYHITGIIIINVTAEYIGPDILICDPFDKADVVIKAYTSNNKIIDIHPTECIFTDLYIYSIGDNIKYLEYTDTTNKYWLVSFIVTGIKRPIEINAAYTGDFKFLNEYVDKSEVDVYVTYLVGEFKTEEEKLDESDWYFVTFPQVSETNDGRFTVAYDEHNIHLTDIINVPWMKVEDFRLRAWYEGPPIEVGKKYEYDDVRVFFIWKNGDQRLLKYTDLSFSGALVEKEGDNWYTVTYHHDKYVFKQSYPVPGYIPKVYPDVDFRVIYVDVKHNFEETDYTEKFREKFTVDDTFIISWKQFLVEVNELMLYGLYILTAPKLCGLSNKYDQDWEVLCINKTTLKANIMKTYLKEEDLPWQEQNQLEQQ